MKQYHTSPARQQGKTLQIANYVRVTAALGGGLPVRKLYLHVKDDIVCWFTTGEVYTVTQEHKE